ncbi:chorismate mutase [Candidatus Woesearchaeota archaeon]|nr:chorismate mutase [Candidatus Woesearchaeota archaeon]
MDAELCTYRTEIDLLDYQLLDTFSKQMELGEEARTLLGKRMKTVERVAQYKQEHGLPFFDSVREKEILASRCKYGAELGLSPAFVTDLFQRILEESHCIYRNKEI